MKPFGLFCLTILALAVMLTSCSGFSPVVPTATVAPTLPPTSVPSPASPPAPTILLEPKLYNIDVAQLQEVPQDVLEQMYTFSGSAGGGDDLGNLPESEQPNMPVWIKAYADAIKPTIPGFLRWTVKFFLPDLPSEIWITLPDGSKTQVKLIPISWDKGSYWIEYEIVPQALLGTYSLEITQSSFVLKDSVTLVLPTKPIWTTYQDIAWYAGFQPSEQIPLHICENISLDSLNATDYPDIVKYTNNWSNLNGTICQKKYIITITADEYGAFRIQVPKGYSSGVKAEAYGFDTTIPTCGDALPLRLKVGDVAKVTDYGEKRGMTSEYKPLITLTSGAKVKTVFGPICAQRTEWKWIVELSDQTTMYVFESDDKDYFLEPVKP